MARSMAQSDQPEEDAVSLIKPQESIGEQPAGFEKPEDELAGQDNKFPKSVFFIIGNEFCERYARR